MDGTMFEGLGPGGGESARPAPRVDARRAADYTITPFSGGTMRRRWTIVGAVCADGSAWIHRQSADDPRRVTLVDVVDLTPHATVIASVEAARPEDPPRSER
jgi:hypothetical protein